MGILSLCTPCCKGEEPGEKPILRTVLSERGEWRGEPQNAVLLGTQERLRSRVNFEPSGWNLHGESSKHNRKGKKQRNREAPRLFPGFMRQQLNGPLYPTIHGQFLKQGRSRVSYLDASRVFSSSAQPRLSVWSTCVAAESRTILSHACMMTYVLRCNILERV